MNETWTAGVDAASTIDAVKNSVIASIASADADVTIRKTDYFNHTYAPDLVLGWPGEQVDRPVYLRTTSNPGYLAEDLGYLDEGASIVMPLGDIASVSEDVVRTELGSRSRARRVLVTAPSSIGTLGNQREARPVVGLAARALLQGGSGLMNQNEAADFGEVITAGFAAAQTGEPAATKEALQAADAFLDIRRSGEVADFLHAVWIGSGSAGTSFPGEAGLAAQLNASALNLLLETIEIDAPEFWDRVAKNLTMEKLQELRAGTHHQNFQRLIRAAAPRLKVRSCRVVADNESDIVDSRWFANGAELGLKFGAWTILFSGGRLADFSQPGIESSLTVDALKRRAEQHDVRVSEITIASSNRRLDYATEDDSSITADEALTAIGFSLGAGASVSRATVRTGAADLQVDVPTSTAHGRTASTFYMSSIALSSLPLLLPLGTEQVASLADAVGEHRAQRGAPGPSPETSEG